MPREINHLDGDKLVGDNLPPRLDHSIRENIFMLSRKSQSGEQDQTRNKSANSNRLGHRVSQCTHPR